MKKSIVEEVRSQRETNPFRRVGERRGNRGASSDIMEQGALKNQEIFDLERKLTCLETEISMFKSMVEVQNEIKSSREKGCF